MMRPSFTTGVPFVDIARDSNAYHIGPFAGGTTVTSRAYVPGSVKRYTQSDPAVIL